VLGAASSASVPEALERKGVDFIYVDELDPHTPAISEAVRAASAAGWTRADPSRPGDGWLLLTAPAAR
jgi:hypothetical protein